MTILFGRVNNGFSGANTLADLHVRVLISTSGQGSRFGSLKLSEIARPK